MTLHLSRLARFALVHYPNAHTDGDLVVYFQAEQVAAIGDLIWPKSFPFIDVHNGGSAIGLETALQRLLTDSKSGYRFIPGHGATLTYDDVREYLKMVHDSRIWVTAQMLAGKSLADIQAGGLSNEFDRWSSVLVPTEVWIEMIHASISPSK